MQELSTVRRGQKGRSGAAVHNGGFRMRREDIDRFAADWGEAHNAKTAERYRQALLLFYDDLPEDKRVYKDTLTVWTDALADKYAPNYRNFLCSACNCWLRYMGHEDFRRTGHYGAPKQAQPELTRDEYLLLLDTAKRLRKKSAYLFVKLFAATGIQVPELAAVTVEAVRAGEIDTGGRTVRLPTGLREELLDHALHSGVRTGPIFITRTGRVLDETRVSGCLRELCAAAGLAEGKCRPRTLQKLYRASRAEAEARVADMVERLMLEQADEEQAEHGWES